VNLNRHGADCGGTIGRIGPWTLADRSGTCRGESREASISMTELAKLSGQDRTTMWRAVSKLIQLGHIRRLSRGNQYQATHYEIPPPGARCTDATSTEEVHVASEPSARCTGATHPYNNPDVTIPTDDPALLAGAGEGDDFGRQAGSIVAEWMDAEIGNQVNITVAVGVVAEALRCGLPEGRVITAIKAWQRAPFPDVSALTSKLASAAAKAKVVA
jgi:hypothetical protein